MDINEYFESVQEYIKSNLQNPEELDSIIKKIEKDNIQAIINQDFNSDISIEECGDKILKISDISDISDIELNEPNKLDGYRNENTMERKIMNFTDFINESFLNKIKKISFPIIKSHNNFSFSSRKYLPIIKVSNNIVYLSNGNENIHITKDGIILYHSKNGRDITQLYNIDEITKSELKNLE